MKYLQKYESPLGKILLASDGENLTGLWFEGQKYFGENLADEVEEKFLPIFEKTFEWLKIYFSGREPNFTPQLKVFATDFRKNVCENLLRIPYGEVTTYGEIAKKINSSARAVGGAVARNPISIIIPCHRVIGSNKSLTSYSAGIDKKIKLLELEKNFS